MVPFATLPLVDKFRLRPRESPRLGYSQSGARNPPAARSSSSAWWCSSGQPSVLLHGWCASGLAVSQTPLDSPGLRGTFPRGILVSITAAVTRRLSLAHGSPRRTARRRRQRHRGQESGQHRAGLPKKACCCSPALREHAGDKHHDHSVAAYPALPAAAIIRATQGNSMATPALTIGGSSSSTGHGHASDRCALQMMGWHAHTRWPGGTCHPWTTSIGEGSGACWQCPGYGTARGRLPRLSCRSGWSMAMARGLQNHRSMTTVIHRRLADGMAFLSLSTRPWYAMLPQGRSQHIIE